MAQRACDCALNGTYGQVYKVRGGVVSRLRCKYAENFQNLSNAVPNLKSKNHSKHGEAVGVGYFQYMFV